MRSKWQVPASLAQAAPRLQLLLLCLLCTSSAVAHAMGRHGAAPGSDVWVCEGCGPVQHLLSFVAERFPCKAMLCAPHAFCLGRRAQCEEPRVQEAQCCVAVQQWALHRAVLCCMVWLCSRVC